MGGVLGVRNNRLDDFEILQANIFTSSQGICLQRLAPKNTETFKFDCNLAYGSWYDIQIIGRSRDNGDNETLRYLKKGIYLSCDKIIEMTELTHEEHRDHGVQWECGECKGANFGSVAICEHCHTNKSQKIITAFSDIPLVGIPFSLADAILKCGKASQSNKMADNIDAGVTTTFAVVDVITAPFIVGSLVKIPAKIAAEYNIKLTAKNVFCEAGKPLLKEIGKELGGVPVVLKVAKEGVKKSIEMVQ
jgi:hypothetical protein